jgi:hypothetical protein
MRPQRTLAVMAVVIVLALAPSSAVAMEILDLTQGSIVIGTPGHGTTFNVSGPRVSISWFVSQIFTSVPCWNLGAGCQPGTVDSVGWFGDFNYLGGTVTLDGVLHGGGGSQPGNDYLFLFQQQDFTAPSPVEAAQVTLRYPFSIEPQFGPGLNTLHRFGGTFTNAGPDDYVVYGLRGAGHVDLTLVQRADGEAWVFQQAEWVIEPTPEPATLLLWGTAAAGLGVARWVRRRRSG